MLCKDEKRLSIRKWLHWILRPSCSSLCCLGKWTWNQAVSPKKPERLDLSKAKKTCCHLASFPNRRRVTKCSYFFQGFNQEHQVDLTCVNPKVQGKTSHLNCKAMFRLDCLRSHSILSTSRRVSLPLDGLILSGELSLIPK